MKRIVNIKIGIFSVMLLSIAINAANAGVVLDFDAFENPGPDFAGQVEVDVHSDKAWFTFTNNSDGTAANSSIEDIYFEFGLQTLGLSGGYMADSSGLTGLQTVYPFRLIE